MERNKIFYATWEVRSLRARPRSNKKAYKRLLKFKDWQIS